LKGQFNALSDAVNEREDNLEETATKLGDFLQNFRNVEEDVEQLIDVLSDQRPVSHDIEIIKEQQDEFKVLVDWNNKFLKVVFLYFSINFLMDR
jgi:glutathionylspermidine synthase